MSAGVIVLRMAIVSPRFASEMSLSRRKMLIESINMPDAQEKRLANQWNDRLTAYDFVIVGSGYGGAITAARLANSAAKPSVCILERGKEWPIGTFPDKLEEAIPALRSDLNPLGLYEILNYRDVSVIKGSGLGGTSLINANVAIIPNREIFERTEWPRSLKYDSLMP